MIEINNISKCYKIYQKPLDRIFELVSSKPRHQLYSALKDISISINPGEIYGVIGNNGAGKSTLLKIVAGIIIPDSGSVNMVGRVAGLLELGSGFDATLSGLRNITVNGLLLGMTISEIEARTKEIVEFAELGDFIHEPLRVYSSGMVMRLGFAIAIHSNPTCFVVDEALAVGDAYFQQKCFKKIRQYKEEGGSILFVSHDLNAIKVLCDRALVLHQGKVAVQGTPEQAVNFYSELLCDLDGDITNISRNTEEYGTRELEILSVCVEGENSGSSHLSSGESSKISVTLISHVEIDNFTIGMVIRDRFGQDIFGTNSQFFNHELSARSNQEMLVEFTLGMELAAGQYSVSAAIHSETDHLGECYHWVDNVSKFEVSGVQGVPFTGVCRLPTVVQWKILGQGNV